MALPLLKTPFTSAEYLVWEADQVERHDFIDGEVFAMSGAEDRHVTIALNIGMALRNHLTGGACRVYLSDMKLNVKVLDRYFYPDIMVTCSPTDRENRLIKSEPKLIVEILSKSTANYDRGEKFVSYRHIPSLREYVMVDIDSRQIEAYRLGDQGLWVLHPVDLRAAASTLLLASVHLTLTTEQVFAEID